MAEPFTVTFDAILDEVDYEPRRGTKYEIAEGVFAEMRTPTEAVIEAYEEIGEGETEINPKRAKQITFEKAKVVLRLPDGFDWDENKGRLIWPVIDRVSEDFFFLSRPKPSGRMKSLMEAVREMQSDLEAKSQKRQATRPNDHSVNGPSGSQPDQEAGPSSPSASQPTSDRTPNDSSGAIPGPS